MTALTTDRSVCPSGGVTPSMAMTLRHVSDDSRPENVALAPATPGTRAARSSSSRYSCRLVSGGTGCWSAGGLTRNSTTWPGSKPRSTSLSDIRLRTNKPAATRSTSETAICVTTSVRPKGMREAPRPPAPPLLRTPSGSRPLAASVGRKPNSTAVPHEISPANSRTRPSGLMSSDHGQDAGQQRRQR